VITFTGHIVSRCTSSSVAGSRSGLESALDAVVVVCLDRGNLSVQSLVKARLKYTTANEVTSKTAEKHTSPSPNQS
jgi:hypothetical protein